MKMKMKMKMKMIAILVFSFLATQAGAMGGPIVVWPSDSSSHLLLIDHIRGSWKILSSGKDAHITITQIRSQPARALIKMNLLTEGRSVAALLTLSESETAFLGTMTIAGNQEVGLMIYRNLKSDLVLRVADADGNYVDYRLFQKLK